MSVIFRGKPLRGLGGSRDDSNEKMYSLMKFGRGLRNVAPVLRLLFSFFALRCFRAALGIARLLPRLPRDDLSWKIKLVA